MEYSWPASCVHEILQAGILEWDDIPFSRGSSEPRDRTQVSSVARRFFTIWAIREACSNLIGASERKEAPLVLSSPTEDSIPPFFETKVEGSSLLWFCTTSDWSLIIPRHPERACRVQKDVLLWIWSSDNLWNYSKPPTFLTGEKLSRRLAIPDLASSDSSFFTSCPSSDWLEPSLELIH